MADKIERKYMAHFINTSRTSTESWYWLGDDLEEYSIEFSPNIEIERDILGNEYIVHDYNELESEAETFYARKGDKMSTFLQRIIDRNYVGSDCVTQALEVQMWKTPTIGDIVSSDTSDNPSALGWMEKINGKYVPSQDTQADSSKTYYFYSYPAIMRNCHITPTSYGGDSSYYQIPFTVRYFGEPVEGRLEMCYWTFEADE